MLLGLGGVFLHLAAALVVAAIVAIAVGSLGNDSPHDFLMHDGVHDVVIDPDGPWVDVAAPEIDFLSITFGHDRANISVAFQILNMSHKTFEDEKIVFAMSWHLPGNSSLIYLQADGPTPGRTDEWRFSLECGGCPHSVDGKVLESRIILSFDKKWMSPEAQELKASSILAGCHWSACTSHMGPVSEIGFRDMVPDIGSGPTYRP